MKYSSYISPYKAVVCHSAAGNKEAGVCYVCVDKQTEERQTMEGTAGADGTDAAGTVAGKSAV